MSMQEENIIASGEPYTDPRMAENGRKITLDNGRDILYCEFGAENKEIIVTGAIYFITFNEFLKELAKNFHVYGFIMRLDGDGEEKNPDGSINWTRQWGRDIYDAARKLGIGKFHYVGKCHGAMPGWYLVKEHPECLLSLSSISASLHAFPPDADEWTERQKAEGPKFALNTMKKKENLIKKVEEAKVVPAVPAGGSGLGGSCAESGVQDLALVDPNLHADAAIGCGSLSKAVLDVGADGLQGDGTLVIGFAPGDFCAAQTAAAGDLDALGAQTGGLLHGLLHGPAEGNPLLQLLGNVLGHQLCVQIGAANLHDVQVHALAQAGFHILAQVLNLRAGLANDHAGLSGASFTNRS